MTEEFTKTEFEAALPVHKVTGEKLWEETGFISGEWVYRVKLNDKVYIAVRSSIDHTNKAARSGQDSIRAWLVNSSNCNLGSKTQKWVTRLPGWQERMKIILRSLARLHKAAGFSRVKLSSGEFTELPNKVFKVKVENGNKGRYFASHPVTNEFLKWITTADGNLIVR